MQINEMKDNAITVPYISTFGFGLRKWPCPAYIILKPSILKFEVPESWLNKKAKEWDQAVDKLNDAGFSFEKGTDDMFISGGIPTAFLTKVIK